MVAGCHDFLQILLHLFPVIDMGNGKSRKSHNGIHGRPDIMRHIGQEDTLCLTCPVRLQKGVLQKALLLHLTANLVIHTAEAQDNAVVLPPLAGPHGLHLKILYAVLRDSPVIHIMLQLLPQFLPYSFPGRLLAHHLLVFLVHRLLYVRSHAFLQGNISPEKSLEGVLRLVIAQQASVSRVKVKVADKIIVNAQRLHQLHLPSLVLLFLQLLGRTVQNKSLIKQLSVLPKQLDIAHKMQNIAVFMPDTIFDTDTVSLFFQILHTLLESLSVLFQNRGSHHVKAVPQQRLLTLIPQNLQGGTVYADDFASVQGMAQYAAVNAGKKCLQRTVLLYDFLLIGTFLRHIDGYAHRSHHTSVNIIQRGLISGKRTHAVTRFDDLLGYKCTPFGHDLAFRFYTGRVILLHIPDICMPAALHLLLRLAHRPAEAVIHLLMDTILILIPDQIRDIINGGLKKMAVLPGILFRFVVLLPPGKSKAGLPFRHGKPPYVLHRRKQTFRP